MRRFLALAPARGVAKFVKPIALLRAYARTGLSYHLSNRIARPRVLYGWQWCFSAFTRACVRGSLSTESVFFQLQLLSPTLDAALARVHVRPRTVRHAYRLFFPIKFNPRLFAISRGFFEFKSDRLNREVAADDSCAVELYRSL
jgi:hypothetical protein